jgi:hypothetical protein
MYFVITVCYISVLYNESPLYYVFVFFIYWIRSIYQLYYLPRFPCHPGNQEKARKEVSLFPVREESGNLKKNASNQRIWLANKRRIGQFVIFVSCPNSISTGWLAMWLFSVEIPLWQTCTVDWGDFGQPVGFGVGEKSCRLF